MSLPLVLRRAARKEFDAAADWYEQRRSGLGPQFIAEVERIFDRVVDNPEFYPLVHRDIREALVRRFPYVVYYRVESARVVVIAVIHGARNPSIWQRRS
jgi:plasmid stabilization system protein ParE